MTFHVPMKQLDAAALERILRTGGHRLARTERISQREPLPVPAPRARQLLHLAMQPDFTLVREYRAHYFLVDSEQLDDQLLGLGESAFVQYTSNRAASDELSDACTSFLKGPISWLASQIDPGDGLIFWPGLARPSVDSEPAEDYVAIESLYPIATTGSGLGHLAPFAIRLCCPQALYFAILYESARATYHEEHLRDYFVYDEGAATLFKIHHHDRVEAMIPNAALHQRKVEDLRSRPGRFIDVSDYYDPEFDDDE